MLQIKHISKQYKTGDLVQRALDDVSLNLRDNEFVAILGPSGSGKTTLLNIIGGLDRYDKGDLIINGVSTSEYNDRDWDTYRNHSIGFVFQSYNLIQHQNVLANVELALTIGGLSAKERKERAQEALEKVGLGEQVHKKPNQLSGGQMQRVALARALVNDPDILLADEPTGALDTETSIQVMDLIKEVAKDRLVVMVTHNPELADEYASRIVRLKDGKITDDSMPFSDAQADAQRAVLVRETESRQTEKDAAGQAASEPPVKANKKQRQASMSFKTSLGLSFSNLRTKKGRTVLTSFAGSIGIIGIALILSLSTGVNNYIDKIQRDTMASYPITISATSFDLASIMGGSTMNAIFNDGQGKVREEGRIYANYGDIQAGSAVTTSIKENNLTEFKKYLDNPESEIHPYIGENGIVYSYDVTFKVYTYDSKGRIVDTDSDVTQQFADENNVLGNMMEAGNLMMSNMSAMFGYGGDQNAMNFAELTPGINGEAIGEATKENYNLIYGSWPDSYDEVVLILNGSNNLRSGAMYQLGFLTREEYEAAVRRVEKDEVPEDISWQYQDILDHPFYLLTASDHYVKNENGTFSPIGSDKDKLKAAMEQQALQLKITGIIKAESPTDMQNMMASVGYTSLLSDYMIAHGNESELVLAQENQPDTDVLTGQAFEEAEPDDASKAQKARKYLEELSPKGKEEALSTIVMLDYAGGMEAIMATQMGPISEQISAVLAQTLGPVIEQAVTQVMTEAMKQMQPQMEATIAKVIEQAMPLIMQQVFIQVMPKVLEEIAAQVEEKIWPTVREEILPQVLEQAILQNLKKTMDEMDVQLGDKFPAELEPLKTVTTLEELRDVLNDIDFTAIDYSDIDFAQLDFSNIDYTDIDFSMIDFSVIDLSVIDLGSLDFSTIDFSTIDMSSIDLSGIDFSTLDLSGVNFGNIDMSAMSRAFEGMSFSEEDADASASIDYWLKNIATQSSLVKVFDQLVGISTYDGNMEKFGWVSYDAPSMISLYADSFEGKDGIALALDHYNEQADEEHEITYTDYVALLTSSITTIINAISYVLIGFVAVSLFVSCIMIGIITNISVLERTKEIGVLRALGASKRNISNVFNAETFIIGCMSGILGVVITLLLNIPINFVIHSLMGSAVLSAKLPPVSGVILVIISIVITIIGGLIPARKASRKDPVEALRSE